MHSRIFLIGFMGSGKTTLGKRLANLSGYSFADMDQIIEQKAGVAIPEIFRVRGEEVFRKWERDILEELSNREQLVISTGGGAPCHGNMMDLMNQCGLTVYLSLPPEILKDRLLGSRTERPLIRGKNAEELLEYIRVTLQKREPYYRRARLIVDGVNPNLNALFSAIENS